MRPAHRRMSRGFTLVELMVVVAIIGLLASIATSELSRMLLRVKAVERKEVISVIRKAVADTFLQENKALMAGLTGLYQPPLPPTMGKRVPDWTQPGWAEIFSGGGAVEGSFYYSYKFQAQENGAGGRATLDLWVHGDLDGDGAQSVKYVHHERRNGLYYTDESDQTGYWVSPPNGQDDIFTY